MKLNEVLVLRITTELKQKIEKQAERLSLRPVDIIRMAIAKAVSYQDYKDDIEANRQPGN